MISNQIEEEVEYEFKRQRAMFQNQILSDKQLWANVIVNHVQRVKSVISHLKQTKRMSEINTIEGITKLLANQI